MVYTNFYIFQQKVGKQTHPQFFLAQFVGWLHTIRRRFGVLTTYGTDSQLSYHHSMPGGQHQSI